MSANNTFLAVFLGSKTSPKAAAWNALPEAERRAKEREGMAAWKAWVEKHQASLLQLGAFTVVRAASHEAAAKLFEGHPHFTIFPGETIEIMPILPIPAG